MEKLTQTNSIIQRLFDPTKKSYKVFVDENRRQVYQSMPLEAKMKYIEYYLNEHWQEICGEHLAKNCSVESLQSNILTIRTSSSLLANELFMMKGLLLQKINKALGGSFSIKELKFHTCNIAVKKKLQSTTEKKEEAPSIICCPQCGAKMLSNNVLCNVCDRKAREKIRSNITELLKVQPWLKYEECQQYVQCDRITFNDAKEILQNYYFEKVRLDYASELDCYMAVMLLTNKSAGELDEKTYANSLEYLRRNQDVSASRI